MRKYTVTDREVYIEKEFFQDKPAPSFTALDAKILELTHPYKSSASYLRDVLKWGFTISQSSAKCGIVFCDGQLIQRVPPQKPETLSGRLKAGIPLIEHPVQEPVYDTQLSWEDFPLSLFDYSAGHYFSVICFYIQIQTLNNPAPHYAAMVGIPGNSNVPYFKLRIDTGSSELWVLGDNYQTIDAKPNLRAGDIPHHTSYHPGPTARSHGPSMFQVNHRNCLGAAGPIYDDTWNFPTRAGSQLGVRMNFGVAQKVHAFLARSELDGILGLCFAPDINTNRETSESYLTEPRNFLATLHAEGLIDVGTPAF
ncbi:hypothetical protein JB92DRAFT_3120076 [Gautieria morchelliformis]|nr:hypothetical protein JB92DRAFT_3120076 [Gautieria morchelliformis]